MNLPRPLRPAPRPVDAQVVDARVTPYAPPPRPRRGPIVALAAVLALVVLGGVGWAVVALVDGATDEVAGGAAEVSEVSAGAPPARGRACGPGATADQQPAARLPAELTAAPRPVGRWSRRSRRKTRCAPSGRCARRR